MASDQHDTVFPEEDLDDDDDESQEDEEEDDDDDAIGEQDDDEDHETSSVAVPVSVPDVFATVVTVAVPGSAVSNGANTTAISTTTAAATTIVVPDSVDPKRHRIDHTEEKKPLDDSRRLFQRLWTDEDEIELLQGFLEYTTQRGSSHHQDTSLFYDQIKSKLQLDFNKNQLVEKLRRLKKKYRNVLNKISSGKELSFKSPHDQATFEISRKIWSDVCPIGAAVEDNALDDDEISPNPNPNPNFSHSMSKNEVIIGIPAEKRTPSSSRKRPRSRSGIRTDEKRELNLNDGLASNKDNYCITNTNNNHTSSNHNIPGLIEETVKSCLSPLFKEILTSTMGGTFGARGFGGLTLNPTPLSFNLPSSLMNFGSGEMVDEKWRKQQILELEVYSKRLELVQEQIKTALEDLRSARG